MLRNEWTELDISGQSLIPCGVDDIWAGRANPSVIPDNGSYLISILSMNLFTGRNGMQTSSLRRTHGGQVNNGVFQLLDYSGLVDVRGVSIKNETVMYVTRGIGASETGYDYRLFYSPEIVLINPPGDTPKV